MRSSEPGGAGLPEYSAPLPPCSDNRCNWCAGCVHVRARCVHAPPLAPPCPCAAQRRPGVSSRGPLRGPESGASLSACSDNRRGRCARCVHVHARPVRKVCPCSRRVRPSAASLGIDGGASRRRARQGVRRRCRAGSRGGNEMPTALRQDAGPGRLRQPSCWTPVQDAFASRPAGRRSTTPSPAVRLDVGPRRLRQPSGRPDAGPPRLRAEVETFSCPVGRRGLVLLRRRSPRRRQQTSRWPRVEPPILLIGGLSWHSRSPPPSPARLPVRVASGGLLTTIDVRRSGRDVVSSPQARSFHASPQGTPIR